MRKRDGKPQGGDGRKGGPMWMGRSVGGSKSALRREDGRPATQKMRVRFLGQEDSLEKEMATHFSILA